MLFLSREGPADGGAPLFPVGPSSGWRVFIALYLKKVVTGREAS